MSYVPLFTSEQGVTWLWRDDPDGPGATAVAVQDVGGLLEQNKAMSTHNDGYTPSREMRRVASIPAVIQMKWMIEEGWDCMSNDPGCQKKLAEKLDSNEYMYLRTAPGRLGDHYKHSRK